MYLRTGSVLALLLGLFGATSSEAAALLDDGFESGTLLTSDSPAGKWGAKLVAPSCSGAVTADAAHQGGRGFAVVDGAGGANLGAQVLLTQSYAPASTVFGRFWFRMTASNQKGSFIFSNLEDVGGSPMIMLRMKADTRQIQAVSANNLQTEKGVTLPFNPPLFSWHLFEFQVDGIGTTTGTAKLWIDGELQATFTNNFVGLEGRIYSIGEPVSEDSTFTGTLHFDDVRLSSTPLASQWALAALPTLTVGTCAAVTASLRTSLNGAEAPAPHPLTASLSSAGVNGGFYSDSSCTAPITSLAIAAGASSATLYYRPEGSGTVVLTASQVDFLPGSLSVPVSSGGTSPGTPGTVGGPESSDESPNPEAEGSCSAMSGSIANPLILLALVRLVRRHRSRQMPG